MKKQPQGLGALHRVRSATVQHRQNDAAVLALSVESAADRVAGVQQQRLALQSRLQTLGLRKRALAVAGLASLQWQQTDAAESALRVRIAALQLDQARLTIIVQRASSSLEVAQQAVQVAHTEREQLQRLIDRRQQSVATRNSRRE